MMVRRGSTFESVKGFNKMPANRHYVLSAVRSWSSSRASQACSISRLPRTLLRDGVLISEQVANARSLVGRRAEFLSLPLNIVGGDGAPARVLGRAIHD